MSIITLTPYGPNYPIQPDADETLRTPTAFLMIKKEDVSATYFLVTAYLYQGDSFFTIRKMDNSVSPPTTELLEMRNTIDEGISTKFKLISSLQYKNGKLFVLDKVASTVTVYDIENLVSGAFADDTLNKTRFIKAIGGFGGVGDIYAFNTPENLFFNDTNILVYDYGNSAVKEYDFNLNWVETYRKRDDLDGINCINYLLDGDKYVALRNNGNLVYFDRSFVITKEISNFITMKPGEVMKNLIISDNIPNLVYIVTDRRILKKYASNDQNIIGFINTTLSVYEYSVFGQVSPILYSGVSANNSFPEDILGVISNVTNGVDIIPILVFYRVTDSSQYLFLKNSAESTETIQFKKSDFHQGLAYAALESIRYDTQTLAAILSLKIIFVGGIYANMAADLAFIPESDLDLLFSDLDLVGIGMNEHPSPDTINRYLSKILGIQKQIAYILNKKEKSTSGLDYLPATPELPKPIIIPIP